MDKNRLDSHKLMFHPQRVADWLNGKTVYPIYMEISPSGACNHRCKFCALDFMGYEKRFIDPTVMEKAFQDMAACGVKSIMFGGEGEPMLHPEFKRLVISAYEAGLDIGITTNGSLLNPDSSDPNTMDMLRYVKWIKASVDAGTPQTHANLHGVSEVQFGRVMRNMAFANKVRKHENLDITLGMQMLLLPENQYEIGQLATAAKNSGMDYLVIKPYSQHPSSPLKYANLDYSKMYIPKDDFIIFRKEAFDRAVQERPYDECYGLPFWGYLSSNGDVWGCSAHLGEDQFLYGNVYKQTFADIWKPIKTYPCSDCRINCRMEACNRYLWELKHPSKHVNFI